MRRLLLAAGAAAALLFAAACGDDAATDDEVASAGGTAEPSEEAEEVTREEAMQNFVDCMRENGVEDMPDPGSNGGFELREEITEDPDFEAAQEACQDELPVQSMDDLDEETQEMILEFVDCMRDNGVEDMPDPQSGGGIMMDQTVADDPEFEAAMEACQDLLEDLRG